jgi:hypothetical protein
MSHFATKSMILATIENWMRLIEEARAAGNPDEQAAHLLANMSVVLGVLAKYPLVDDKLPKTDLPPTL